MMVNGMLAIGVHGVGGLFGVLCMGIFADGNYGKGWNVLTRRHTINRGVEAVVEGKFGQLASQAIRVVVLCTVVIGIAYAFFSLQNKLTKGGIRSEEADETQQDFGGRFLVPVDRHVGSALVTLPTWPPNCRTSNISARSRCSPR